MRNVSEIGDFFIKKKHTLITNRHKGEIDLLESLNFEEELGLVKDKSSKNALFGKKEVRSDYRPKEDKDTIIEVKYIKEKSESYIKDSLAQIIEQAFCQKVKNAILVIIDSGRAAERDWANMEKKFISMFKQNPLGIELAIIRIQFDKNNVGYKIY